MSSDPTKQSNRSIGVLLSGGIDSCVLVAELLKEHATVYPCYVCSGVFWEREELAAIARFCEAVRTPNLRPLTTFDLPLADLYGDHWSIDGRNTPSENTPDEAVYLPGRNALLAIKPALWCRLHGIERLAMAVLASNPFSDATPAFFTHLSNVIVEAAGGRLEVLRPFGHLHKVDVLRLGRDLPLHLTFSCIAPQHGAHCGRCNKCAERKHAFSMSGVPDATHYATQQGKGVCADGKANESMA